MNTPLKLERERRGWTKQEVAIAVGIDRSHYSRIETAEVGASAETAARLATYFGNTVSEMQILYPERYVTQPAAVQLA